MKIDVNTRRKIGIILRPARPDHAQVRLLLGERLAFAYDRHAAGGSVEDQPGDRVGVSDRVAHGDRRAARHTEHGEPLQTDGPDDRLQICDSRSEREVGDVPVGHPETSLVVADDRREATQVIEEMAPDRALPVVLQMAEPTGRDDERWPRAMHRVCEPSPV